MAAREDEDEKVCRLCRTGEDDGLPVLPWACRGSAKWIHKACLKVEEWRRTGSTEDAAYRCGQCMDQLSDLPLELQVHIANAVGGRSDRAALALASPRLLGLAACRQLPSYQGLEMSLAFHHMLGGVIDERVLRGYASRAEATLEGCGWLTAVAAAAGSQTGSGPDPGPGPGSVREAGQRWYLMKPDSTVGALLRCWKTHKTDHYEGAEGAERRLRSDYGSSDVFHYEGEKDAERMVRFVTFELNTYPDVAKLWPNVFHYKGEKGAERMVRFEQPVPGRGKGVTHFEGEKGAERRVRLERPVSEVGGGVTHYEGEKGAERRVRYAPPSGELRYYEGKMGAERMVRSNQPGGDVFHYEGEKDAERLVRLGLQFGFSIHYRGERGTERPKSRLLAMVARALAAIFYFVLCLCQQALLYTTHLALRQW